MTTQTFLSQLTPDVFSEATIQEVHALVGSSTKLTPELSAQIADCLEREIDNDLKEVELDPTETGAFENQIASEIAQAEQAANENLETIQRNLSDLVDMSKKVDVLERLHGTIE